MMKKDAAENLKLYMAAMESYRTGSITPILKEELKYRIQSRRLSEGKDEMIVELDQVKTRKLVRKLIFIPWQIQIITPDLFIYLSAKLFFM